MFGEKLHRLLVVPSARGPFGWSDDYSERDELDVLADVEHAYPVDHNRVFASGYSDEHVAGLEEAGVLGFIAKPYRQYELLQAVRAALDHPRADHSPTG